MHCPEPPCGFVPAFRVTGPLSPPPRRPATRVALWLCRRTPSPRRSPSPQAPALVGKEPSTTSRRGFHATTAGTGTSEAGSLASHSGPTAAWSSSTVAKDGGTKTAQVEPLHSVRGLSLDATRVLPQAARLSRPLALAHGLASLTMMRGLSSAPCRSAAGCAALRGLYARCRRSVPLCAALRPSATGCGRLAAPAPPLQSTALLCSRQSSAALLLRCSGLRPRGCDRLRCCLSARPPYCATSTPPPRLRAI
eukprot:scaffold868_cov86-Phaeocystis_antarctica.AAC.2